MRRCKCTICWETNSPCGREPNQGQTLCTACNLDTDDDNNIARSNRSYQIAVEHPSYWASVVRRLLTW